MAEANQATGAPAGGKTTTVADRLYGNDKPAEPAPSGEATAEPVSLAEKLYGKDPPEEPATEGEQSGEVKDKGVEEADKEGLPERYQLRLPEGAINEPLLNDYQSWAKANKLSSEAAQQGVDMYAKAIGEAAQQWADVGVKRYDEVRGWRAEFEADPYFGRQSARQSISEANRALSAYATPEEVKQLKAEFERTGMGNFPPLVRLLARVGRTVKAPPTGSKPADLAKRLYPDLD